MAEKKTLPKNVKERASNRNQNHKNHTKENPLTLNKLQEKLNWWEHELHGVVYIYIYVSVLFLLALVE